MGNKSVIFTVPGEPKGKARPRVTKFGTYTPKKTKEYETLVAQAFLQATHDKNLKHWMNGEPLAVKIVARFGIPKKTTKAMRKAIYDKKVFVTKQPDIDNIAKIILDGLNGVAFSDDKYICELTVCKDYVVEGMEPHVVVCICELDDPSGIYTRL
jgi:Holliday junction resolvase RusA-like endonuclease